MKTPPSPWRSAACAVMLVALCSAGAQAAPADFRVLNDDLTEAGEFGLELQGSWVRPARSAATPSPLLQGMAEFSYGLAPQWELSLQLPATRADGTWYGTGANLELTFVAPHDEAQGFYWGGRVELGRSRAVHEDWAAGIELRPILGWRTGNWHAVLNPGLQATVSGPEREVDFEPSAKLAYRLRPDLHLGLEYFAEAGPLSHLLPSGQRRELGLITLDAKAGPLELTLGLGKGLTSASDRRVGKLLVSLALD
ncbi:hypothetical protein [Roseateles saccharophilus]|uniref:Transporter n=1 Tax=Roseateles saccharophilus TaxID=304 RepID=A0A4R3UKX7_ROSSA|nr:hypothetical protein [Roseateles saccharophilus]MDG0834225.1 hypothetical protein [Roseateles saccharophilus]TCU89913.1 hypothetical protein EV671_103117 [Roseateles saccharophilus]